MTGTGVQTDERGAKAIATHNGEPSWTLPMPSLLIALIKLPRVLRHFEAADEVGIARHSAHLLADAIGSAIR
jgi:hypothetical protein